jgi:hypothetical protein
MNPISERGDTHFLITLHSGYKTIYERKATFGQGVGAIGFGEDGIPVNGFITAIPYNKTAAAGLVVILQATQNGKLIYETFVKTDNNGNFSSFFIPPEDGTVTINSTLADGKSSSPSGLISVVVTESAGPIYIIAALIGTAIAIMIWARYVYKNKEKKEKGTGIDVLHLSLIPVTMLTIFAYIILFRFPPFDGPGNAAFATAMITPIALYVFQLLNASQNGGAKS